jgi:hypothetical protein
VVDLPDLSPTRVSVANTCGLQYKYQYVDRIPDPVEGAAAILGNVIHDSLEQWYQGHELDQYAHRGRSLVSLVKARWPQVLPTEVWAYTNKVLRADADLVAAEEALLMIRPALKSPRTTKAIQESQEYLKWQDAKTELFAATQREEGISWPGDEDPYRAYLRSIEWAENMERMWRHKPAPVAVERPFRIEVEGVAIKGRLDQFRRDPDPQTGEVVNDLVDVKTGRKPLTQMVAFLQAWAYWTAILRDPTLPDPDQVSFYLTRKNQNQRGIIEPERHDPLALRILRGVLERIGREQFEPHYGHHCAQCDFRSLCEQEISLWTPGSAGLVIEGVA